MSFHINDVDHHCLMIFYQDHFDAPVPPVNESDNAMTIDWNNAFEALSHPHSLSRTISSSQLVVMIQIRLSSHPLKWCSCALPS